MAGEKVAGQPIPQNTGETRKPFWEKPISRRGILIGGGTAAAGLAAAAVIRVLTGRSNPEPTTRTANNTAAKPGQVAQTGANSEGEKTTETSRILSAILQDMDGKEISVKDLAAQKPTVLLTWSILEHSSIEYLKQFTNEVYPQFANSNVQFFAVEIWDSLQRFKIDLATNPAYDPLGPLPFPMVVGKDNATKNPSFYGTARVIMVDKGGDKIQELPSSKYDQITSAIAKVATPGN